MNRKTLLTDKILIIVATGMLLSLFFAGLLMYLYVRDLTVFYIGVGLILALFFWCAVFLHYFQKKLLYFTSDLCRTLDHMIDGDEIPHVHLEEETLLARINHRLERLYNIMQSTQNKVEIEKKELQTLVSDISHQTKTPIANLKMINDTLITRNIPAEKQFEFLQATQSQLNKLAFMIEALVKASRLETGLIVLKKKEMPLYETLVAAINGILPSLEDKNITFSMNCSETLTVPHDTKWTSEAFFNLLDNAVKYTASGGIIRVNVEALEMYLKIDVMDTGKGIPESEQAQIFSRFYREASVHDIEGIGIGLYLTREIITLQGGYIKVTSKLNQGSTFSVFLPCF